MEPSSRCTPADSHRPRIAGTRKRLAAAALGLAFGHAVADPAAPRNDGWQKIEPGGETACARGDFAYYARTASPDRVFIHLDGGGACWDAETCALDSGIYTPEIGSLPAERGGVFDLDHPDNPFADHSMLVVPYCTGDVHLGNRVATYTVESESGETQTFRIPHKGLVNVEAALEWLDANVDTPKQLVVTGSSAGAVATPFHADQLARRYPDARVIGLADAAGAYRSDSNDRRYAAWGVPEVLRAYPGWADFQDEEGPTTGFETLFARAAQNMPNLELYTFEQAFDAAQQFYVRLGGREDFDLLRLIRQNQADIAAVDPEFRSFVVGGIEHTVLGTDRFYFYHVAGRSFRDWVADIVTGNPVASVRCTDCSRPELYYTEADLRLIDNALDLLDSDARWARPDDAACDEAATTWSLACALVHSARQLGDAPVTAYAAFSDVVHSTYEALGTEEVPQRLLTVFNNADDTGFEDVRAVLLDVRDRIDGVPEHDRTRVDAD